MSRRSVGGLDCRVLGDAETDGPPSLAVILCHGFGAPGDDLVPLGKELRRSDPRLAGVRFYFPAASLDLASRGMPGARAWWWLDLDRLVRAGGVARLAELRGGEPDGVPVARTALRGLVDAVLAETGLPASKLVLGGFSQGAMLTTDVALRLPEPPAAVAVLSGNLVNEAEWSTLAANRPPLRFLISHGKADPILPFAGAVALRDLLTAAGHNVTFLPFNDGHTITESAFAALGELLAKAIPNRHHE